MQRDLNDTLVFVKVVELGSFTAASRALALPKTTVSRRLRELEDRLGTRLLNRTTRSLALTEAGTVYYEHSRRVAADLDAAESAVQQLQGAPRGWLRVTAPYSMSATILAPLVQGFRERFPEVRVDAVLSNDRLDLVSDGIDVALRIGDLPDSSLVARRLATWRTQVSAADAYLARYGEPLYPQDLREHRTLALAKYRRNSGFAWPLQGPAGTVEAEIRPVVVANDPEMLLAQLAAGEGLMLIAEPMIRCCPALASLRRVLTDWQGPELELNAVFIGDRVQSPKVRAFIDFVAERMQHLSAHGCSESVSVAAR